MLPSNSKYVGKRESASGRRYRTNLQPLNQSSGYSGNSIITIQIPTRNNTLLIPSESFLKFTLNATNSSGAISTYVMLDSQGAHGFIQKISIYHGSNLLSQIDNYNGLAKVLMDATCPEDKVKGAFSITSGTKSDYITTFPLFTDAATLLAGITAQSYAAKSINCGKTVSSSLAIAATFTDTYCINLMCLLGSLASNKYLPLFEMTSAPIRLELTLVPTLNSAGALFSASVPSASTGTGIRWSLDNVEYIGEFLELSDSAISAIRSGSDSPIQFVVPDFRNYQTNFTLPTSQTNISVPIPAKFSSLKSIFCTIRDNASIGVAKYYPFSHCKFGLSNYNFRIGSEVIPSTAPNTVSEFASELFKSVGSLSDLNHQPSLSIDDYSLNVPVTTGDTLATALPVSSGSFAIGQSMSVFEGTDSTSYFAGANTNTSDIYLQAQFAAQANAVASARFDSWAMFDSVLVCQNGIAYATF
jgi:hypothetical protein